MRGTIQLGCALLQTAATTALQGELVVDDALCARLLTGAVAHITLGLGR